MVGTRRRLASLVLAASVAAASLGLAAPTQAAPVPPAPTDDVEVTTTDGEFTYSDPTLADEPTHIVRGTLRVAFVERRNARGSAEVDLDFSIVTARGGSVPIELAEDLPPELANGAIEAQVVADGSAAPQVAEAVVEVPADDEEPVPEGRAHRVYVATLAKTGRFLPPASIASTFDLSILPEWVAEAGGAITDFEVADVRSLSAEATKQSVAELCSMDFPDPSWDAAEALFPGVSFGDRTGNHLIVLHSPACNAQKRVGIGIGTVGESIDSGGWISLLADPALQETTGVHEIGHNFGLLHANAKGCSAVACGSQEYHDLYSVMGFSIDGFAPPALDAVFRDALGITDDGEVSVVTESIAGPTPLSARGATGGRRAIKAIDPLTEESFWIEYRNGSSRDGGSAYGQTAPFAVDEFRFAPGVTITQPGPGGSLDLLAHPRGSVSNGALAAGESWTSPSGAVTVNAEAIEQQLASDMAVRVDIDPDLPLISTEDSPSVARVGTEATAHAVGVQADLTYAWRSNGRDVATGPTYVPVAADQGRVLTLVVTRPGGRKSTSVPVTVGSGRFATAPTPKVSGTSRVAATLTATPGVWSPTATFTYQWFANGAAISGARSTTYKIASTQKGKRISVKVTATRPGYAPTTRSSASTGTVATNTFRAPTPSIRGTRKVGSTLTALHGTWSPVPTTYRYQWYVGSTAISGQTGKTYRPGASRAGKKIRVKITGSRSGYVTATKYSPYTAAIKR